MQKQQVSSGTVWEERVGYSRAIRIGNHIEISGTVAVNESNEVVGKGNAAEQAQYIFQKIEQILAELNTTLSDVVRTRMYVTDIANWEAVGRVHGRYFGAIKPATSLVEVSALIGPDYLVEVEASALVSQDE